MRAGRDEALLRATRVVEDCRANATAMPVVRSFFDKPSFTVSYVAHDPATRAAAIIDSVLDFDVASGRTAYGSAEAMIAYVKAEGLRVEWLLETHVHADHLSAAPYLQERLGGKIGIGRDIVAVQETFGKLFNVGREVELDGSQFDRLFDDGDMFALGSIQVAVLHVPGHTPADLAYVIGATVFCGDTIFMPDFGTARADFPGGDAGKLYRSIRRLLRLPRETRLFLCHDYKAPGRDTFAWETTVGVQRDANVHVNDGVEEEAFIVLRNERDKMLAMPKLIMPAIQVNMCGGHLPEPEDNGTSYLKIPLNAI